MWLFDRQQRRFLVIDEAQFILVEPDTTKLGWGVVKFVARLQVTDLSSNVILAVHSVLISCDRYYYIVPVFEQQMFSVCAIYLLFTVDARYISFFRNTTYRITVDNGSYRSYQLFDMQTK